MEKLERFFAALSEIAGHIDKVRNEINKDEVERLVNAVLNSKKVYCYGAGRSGFMARSFAQRLMHIGIEAYFIGETITPACETGDLLVSVSGSGGTTSTVSIASKAKELGVTVAAITAHKEGKLAKIADIIVYVPGKTKLVEQESYAPFTSLFDIATLSVLDSVAAEVMARRGVTEELILKRHANVE